jgi:quercetin dioxygenase-like cupin family protein
VLRKGDVVKIQPGVVHWHGASADSEFTHLAISINTPQGVVLWLDRVTDEEYNNLGEAE